jgi:uncharacterized YccA/Bax inhibitor family protein
MMRSANPVLQNEMFQSHRGLTIDVTNGMTVSGVVAKSAILLLCLLLTAGFTWMKFFQAGQNPQAVQGLMTLGLFGGLILAFVTVFKAQWAPITAVFYALFEGLFIGGISAVFEVQFPGIVIQGASLTFGTLGAMLLAYQAGLVKATERFKLGVVAATGGIAVVYIVALVLSFFNIPVGFVWGNGIAGILFSVFVVGIAALNLVIDFDFIEQGARRGAPKYMEWYGAFALMVTLVWLYIEFLRLISKLRSR